MAKQQQRQQDGARQSPVAAPQEPTARPYVVRLEWRRDAVFGTRDLWMVRSDGTAAMVVDAG